MHSPTTDSPTLPIPAQTPKCPLPPHQQKPASSAAAQDLCSMPAKDSEWQTARQPSTLQLTGPGFRNLGRFERPNCPTRLPHRAKTNLNFSMQPPYPIKRPATYTHGPQPYTKKTLLLTEAQRASTRTGSARESPLCSARSCGDA